jgi:hypothetical protein
MQNKLSALNFSRPQRRNLTNSIIQKTHKDFFSDLDIEKSQLEEAPSLNKNPAKDFCSGDLNVRPSGV